MRLLRKTRKQKKLKKKYPKLKQKIKVGDFVEIFNNDLTIDKFAKISDTIPYRIITSTSQRFEKIYLK